MSCGQAGAPPARGPTASHAILIRAELRVADGLTAAAEMTACHEYGDRNLRNAWLALKAVEEFAETVNLEIPERDSFRNAHAALCVRLAKIRTRSQDRTPRAAHP